MTTRKWPAVLTGVALVWTVPIAISFDSEGAHSPSTSTTKPLPFDPLSKEEQDLAVQTSLENHDVQALLSDAFETIGAALHTEKAYLSLESWPRMADVWFYDYASDQAISVLVDVESTKVHDVERLALQPPLTATEIERAARAVLAAPAIQERLSEAGIPREALEWTARLWTGSGANACPDHRCALVGFFHRDLFLDDMLARVDLSADLDIVMLGTGSGTQSQPGVPP